jgi:branched-chain amino acid transport system substrate-binding protein
MLKNLVNLALFGFLITSFLIVSSCSKQKKDISQENSTSFQEEKTMDLSTMQGTYYIAVGAPLTGPYKELGKTIVEGANLAVEEFNENLDDLRNRVGILIIDDGGLVIEGLSRADLVIEEGVLGVIGHLNSEISIETSRKYRRAGIVNISPASTLPKFTERPEVKGFVFRTIGTDRQLGEEAANYVLAHPEFKRVAVLYNDRSYGISVASEFVRNLAKDSSREIVFYETIPVRTTDHSSTASKVIKTGADIAFFTGEYNDAGYLVTELKKRNPKIQFLAAEGVHNPEFINIAKENAEGTLVIGAPMPSEEIQKIYKERYGKSASGYLGTSYLGTKILLEAMQANKFKNPEAIAKTVSENSIFDPNGDLIKPEFVFYKVQDGVFLGLEEKI